MNKTMKFAALALGSFAMMAVACGDHTGSGGRATTSSTTTTGTDTTGTGGGMPMVPALGTQIDRMGRPAINTATIMTFAGDDERGPAQNEYNSNPAPTDWATDYVATIAGSLGVLDSLDATCGNQLTCADTAAGCYDTNATVLSNDYLIVKGNATQGCNTYLAVEANFLGVTNDDCGGRVPKYDVIETSYSALAGVGLAGFDDTIAVPPHAQIEQFPYLGTPH